MNPYRLSTDELVKKATDIRKRIVVLNSESPAGGHTGADLSQVEIVTSLYFRILNCAPDRLDSKVDFGRRGWRSTSSASRERRPGHNRGGRRCC